VATAFTQFPGIAGDGSSPAATLHATYAQTDLRAAPDGHVVAQRVCKQCHGPTGLHWRCLGTINPLAFNYNSARTVGLSVAKSF